MSDLLKPGAIPPVEVKVPADEFDNLIRKWGVGFCCHWFGHNYDSDFTNFIAELLLSRSNEEDV